MNNVTPLLTPAEDDPNVQGDKVVARHCRPEMMEHKHGEQAARHGQARQRAGRRATVRHARQRPAERHPARPRQGCEESRYRAQHAWSKHAGTKHAWTNRALVLAQHVPERTVRGQGEKFDEYAPAYRTGYEGRAHYAGQRFEEVQDNLQRDYENNRGESTLGWDKARQACRAAWDHSDKSMSSQTDRQQGR